MSLRFEKCGPLAPEGCEEFFHDSDIYTHYFEGRNLQRYLSRAAAAGELYVAYDEENRPIGVMKVAMRGFCGLYPYLNIIGVHAKNRGKGIGAFLMAELERMTLASGAKRVALLVSDSNEAGQRFYERLGYWTLGVIPNALNEGVNELVMIKDLA